MSSRAPDPYRVLQVDPGANALVIQAAYRVLARIFHPDAQGDADQMTRINAAWEILGDPRSRARYDVERAARHPGPTEGTAAPTVATQVDNPAGRPMGEPFGPLLTFGRYAGWTIGQVARVDRPYLDWLRQAPAGRSFRDEIDAVLRSTGMPGVDRRRYERDRQYVGGWATGVSRGI